MAATVDYSYTVPADYHNDPLGPGVQVGPTSDNGSSLSLEPGLCPVPTMLYPHQQSLSRPSSSMPDLSPPHPPYHSYSTSFPPNLTPDVDQSACGQALPYPNPPAENRLTQLPGEHVSLTHAIDQQHRYHLHHHHDPDFDNRKTAYHQQQTHINPCHSAEEDGLKSPTVGASLHPQFPWNVDPSPTQNVDEIVALAPGPVWNGDETPSNPRVDHVMTGGCRSNVGRTDHRLKQQQPHDKQDVVRPNQDEQNSPSPNDFRKKNRLAARRCRGKIKRREQHLKEQEKTLISQGMALRLEYNHVHGQVLYLRNEVRRHSTCNCEFIQRHIHATASAPAQQQQPQYRQEMHDQDMMMPGSLSSGIVEPS